MGGMTASMNCLVCGHKLAIFRKLSLGDFCCQEHRSLFIREQSDRGLARLMETNGETKSRAAGTRVYAQFLLDELPARSAGGADNQDSRAIPPSARNRFSRLTNRRPAPQES